jgi:hypothetical protein
MDQERQDKASGCAVSDGSRWWRSRTGWRICSQCHPDPLEALQDLVGHTLLQAFHDYSCSSIPLGRGGRQHEKQWNEGAVHEQPTAIWSIAQ